jgi:cephalosporin hydroxylase
VTEHERRILIDLDRAVVVAGEGDAATTHPFSSPDAFSLVSQAWLRIGWDLKYVYGFTWLGRPIIQLPDDMFRIQEVIYRTRPDIVVETGVAHGGSLVFYASVLKAMGGGRVLGIDVEIRPHNRAAIEAHELGEYITLVEGSSIDPQVVSQVAGLISPDQRVLVMLDSNHSRDHVLAELHAYSGMVTPGSYIVAADGIMAELAGAPRSSADWAWNNPRNAVSEFLQTSSEFELEEPPFPFNEGSVTERVTYWPGAFLRRKMPSA